MKAMNPFDRLHILVRVHALQCVGHVNSFYHKDFAVLFDLADGLAGEISVACVDATRLQRAS